MRWALVIAACLLLAAAGPEHAIAQDAPASSASLGSALEAFLRDRSPERVARIDLPPLDGLAREAAREGRQVTFSVHPDQPLLGAVPVGVSLWKDGVLEQKSIVTAQVVVARPTLVARRALAGGTVVAAEDVAIEQRSVSSPHADALSEPGEAVSRKLRRSVGKGEPLRAALLDEAATVRRGDRVTVRLEHGALTIETAGRAEEAGGVGQWIRVRNLSSQRELLGRIGKDGVVHVEP